MTINATAAWLLALYMVTAEEQGVGAELLQGTTQNDIIKEYLSRGTYAFPPGPSLRLIADMVAYTVEHVPKWNPVNVCSYHLQEAGATPVQEIAYSMCTAIAILDAVRERVPEDRMGAVFGRISFFVNAGVRFVEEHAKLRAMAVLWDELGRERYGVPDERHRRFRYGVQVNSLGLTESQPENNVQRIVLEALAVTLGRSARARAVQLPAWNEALGLPRPWDQQWSLRIQQVLAYETDLLEYPDIFEGSKVMDGLMDELLTGARAEMARVAERGGAVEAVPYMKAALVESHRERLARIESGEQVLVGVNRFPETEPSPLTQDETILVVDPGVEDEAREAIARWRAERGEVTDALAELRRVAASDENIMEATLAAARAGVTTGEWAAALRDVFGSYRAPTGVGEAASPAADEALRDEVARVSEALGRTLKILVGKPGLDGHSNGAEQIAVRARDSGMDVVYEGIRLTPAQIARSAIDEGVHVIGLSILSGSHKELVPEVIAALDGADIPVVAGGIIPEADVAFLEQAGVAAVYTPKDFELDRIMRDIVALVAERNSVTA
jgi:(2R)-ethylmalonyl-CoA mutase